jgi:beta-lactamase regulating signal transducer with metallopeptidase domain
LKKSIDREKKERLMLNAICWNLLLTTGLAVAIAMLSRLTWLQRRPALRHWLWLWVMVKLITPPLISVPLLPALANHAASTAIAISADNSTESAEPGVDSPIPANHSVADATLAQGHDDSATDGVNGSATDSANIGDIKNSELRDFRNWASRIWGAMWLLPGLLAISLLGTCVLWGVHGVRAAKLYRWLNRAGMDNALLTEACTDIASCLKIRGGVRSGVVDAQTTPMLWGWQKPFVIMPRQLMNDLAPQQLRSIVAHELAHFLRRDHWTNGFAFFIKGLLWWNPVVWWADRELRAAQELCCDAIAIDRCNTGRRSYAATLLKALDFIQPKPLTPCIFVSGMGSQRSILRRFEMIGETQLSYQLSRWTLLGLLVLAIPLVCIPVRGQEKKTEASAAPAPNAKELGEAAAQPQDKQKQLRLHMQEIGRSIRKFQSQTGHYPKDLAELKESLPKDVYSPTGEDYHYEAQRTRSILSSCGNDGIYGNDDDEIMIYYCSGCTSGQRHGLYPLEKEKEAPAKAEERVLGVRPQGNCSISGKVVSAETGEPIEHGRMYLHYSVTHGSIFVNTAADGSFTFKDIPKGPFSLQLSLSPGYRDVAYNPDDKPGPFPPFSLEDGEQRSGITLKAEPACSIAGKILDENGQVPKDIEEWTVLAWFEKDGQKNGGVNYELKQTRVNRKNGTYLVDGLSTKPAYVQAIMWQEAIQGDSHSPVYYPGVSCRSDAKPVTFEENRHAENIDIPLKTEDGITLEGTVYDEAGKPVPEAFIVVHHRDMLFDFVAGYTDEQGHYRIQGLSDGELLVHIDAVHRGVVRMRTPVNLKKTDKNSQMNFTLPQGVTISGKFVDEEGKEWTMGESFGSAHLIKDEKDPENKLSRSFSLTNFRNKHRPKDTSRGSGGEFSLGEGPYDNGEMLFPAKSTFLIQGMTPGRTMLTFLPNKEGQKVVKILVEGQDVLPHDTETPPVGFETKSGQDLKDVIIVIGKQ